MAFVVGFGMSARIACGFGLCGGCSRRSPDSGSGADDDRILSDVARKAVRLYYSVCRRLMVSRDRGTKLIQKPFGWFMILEQKHLIKMDFVGETPVNCVSD